MTKVQVGDTVITVKPHACGGNIWSVTRTGADYKIKCGKCGKVVMLSAQKFNKAVKNVVGTQQK